MALQALLNAACAAQQRAYAPYSEFPVGAALLTSTGQIVTGCNVENASYGLTICAERAALVCAVREGYRKFRAIAIVAPHSKLTPCGACRQVLAEFGDLWVICADSRDLARQRRYRLRSLLPASFQINP
ncbi:MAG: cytidine deaminase [Verrucomicrobiae bacterium]|nr:cytidine deaminase [Verrucomicrobiae bacterium]